jgi:hypothetical protein
MWIVWRLIIFGGVWDAATSIRLRNAEADRCLTVLGQRSQQMVKISDCRAGDDSQTRLWQEKRLQNKMSERCLGVPKGRDHILEYCQAPKGYNSGTEFIRWGEHGLKTSKGKCLKINSGPSFTMDLVNSTGVEDKDDPYYE